jgi:hypothetical protein
MELQDPTGLLAVLASASATTAALVAALKALAFPDAWQHGRAPMIAAAIIAAGFTALGAWQLALPVEPGSVVAAVTGWLMVYTGAIGTRETVTKAARVVAGTTNPAGEDRAAGGWEGPDAP